MADRKVAEIGKDSNGRVSQLINKPEWGKVGKQAAIAQIDKGTHTYYIADSAGRSDIQTVRGAQGKYLRASPKGSCGHKLEELPAVWR